MDKLWITLWVTGIKDINNGLLSCFRGIYCPHIGKILNISM